MSGIKAVIFDVFGTLIDIDEDQGRPEIYTLLAHWLGYNGFFADPNDLQALYRDRTRQAVESNPNDHPDIRVEEVFRSILLDLPGTSGADPEAILDQLVLVFRLLITRSLTLYPETISNMEQLRDKTRLAIASNTQRGYTIAELRHFDLLQYFEHIVFSSDLYACKPNPSIFRAVLKKLDVTPQETIYIGDNPFTDVYGASRLGMRTVHIERSKHYDMPTGIVIPSPDRKIELGEFASLPRVVLEMIAEAGES